MTFERYRRIFRRGSFRLFWLGFSFSVLGDAMTRVALTWFVYDATGSARAIGWLMLCYTGPIVVGGLLAGPLLDRFDRRWVMGVDNAVRGVAVAAVPLLHALGRLEVWHVYVVAAIYGLLMMISLAGGPSLVPDLVDEEELATANALETLSFTLGGVVGPPLAGLLIGALGAPNVVIVDAISYAAFALALFSIKLAAGPVATAPRQELRYTFGHAFQLFRRNRVLRSTTLMFMIFNIGGGLLAVWLPVLSDRTLGGGPGLYGALLGALAAGEVLSAVLAGSIVLPYTLGTLICLAQALSGLSLLILLGRNVWLATVGLILYGACSAPLTIWAQTLRMQIIPERLRGRTFALLRTMMQGGGPIGGAAGGLLLPVFGIPAMIALSAVVVGAPGLVGLRVAALRRDDTRTTLSGDPSPTPVTTSSAEGQG